MQPPNWFVAFPLPPEAGWDQAAVSAPAALRRFAPSDLHLTLAFLGPCGEACALAAWRLIAGLESPPLAIQAAAWRALGPARSPSAYGLSLGLGHGPLAALLGHWGDRLLAAADRPAAGREPLPHVTLLRPTRREAPAWRDPMRRWMAAAPLPEAPAVLDRIALYTWAPDRRQQLFRVVHQRLLG